MDKRYRIREIIEAIPDKGEREKVFALICYRLRISHTTMYRKIDSDQSQEGTKYEFSPAELDAIERIFTEFNIKDTDLVREPLKA